MKILHAGDRIPEFTYDTPYAGGNSFHQLLAEDERPLFLIFLRNFGHPLTRHYVVHYAQTMAQLTGGRLACVVRSKPQVISEHLPEGTLPYTIICDAEGVLYDFVGVRQAAHRFMAYSLAGLSILKAAEKQGFHEDKNAPLPLPLTLLMGREGQVLMAHYGSSITDQPESGAAMQAVLEARKKQMEKLQRQQQKRSRAPAAEPISAAQPEDALAEEVVPMEAVPLENVPAQQTQDTTVPDTAAAIALDFDSQTDAQAPEMPQEAPEPAEAEEVPAPEETPAEAPETPAEQAAEPEQPAEPPEQAPDAEPEFVFADADPETEKAKTAEEEAIKKYGGIAAALFADEE